MTRSAVGCTVLIDGIAVSDGCLPFPVDDPAVLAGLRVIWGRDTPVDQPQPSSCTFTIEDPTEGSRLIPALTIGRRVDVRVDTVIYPDPSVSTIPVMIPTKVTEATATATSDTVTTLLANGSGRAASVTFPPRALSSNPLAWDDVPRALAGQDWRLRATIALPAMFLSWDDWAATIQPVSYTNPDGSDASPFGPVVPFVAGAADAVFTPPPGAWLGAVVRVYPVGPRWVDLDGTSWAATDAAWLWDSIATYVISDLDLLAPAAGAAASAYVFSGRITDLTVSWDGSEALQCDVIAQDWLAELANRMVGDAPWLMEPLGTRAQRIITQSGQPVALAVDATAAAYSVTWRDVDRQPAATLLQQLATSAAGVLWTATHPVTGQVMWLEDPAQRPAALTLRTTPPVIVIPSAAALANALPISACLIEADPVRFVLDTVGTVSEVDLTWREQTLNDKGQPAPTDATVSVKDDELARTIGARRLSVSTQLADGAQGAAVADVYMARSSVLAWQVEGLSWDTFGALDPTAISALMRLLDGTRRVGLPIALTDLPEWATALVGGQSLALYVEGGEYRYDEGAWVVALTTTAAAGSAAGSYRWQDSDPSWAWDDFDPSVSWLDLHGVTYPEPSI
jgi:hypothetical protein